MIRKRVPMFMIAAVILITIGLAGDPPVVGQETEKTKAARLSNHVKIKRKLISPAKLGCLENVSVSNTHTELAIGATIRKTQYLFSGKHEDKFMITLAPGQELKIGCSWWRGAMKKADFEVVETWLLEDETVSVACLLNSSEAPGGIVFMMDGVQYGIPNGQFNCVPMIGEEAMIALWDCPPKGCRWADYTVLSGRIYEVRDGEEPWSLVLVDRSLEANRSKQD